MTSPSPRAACDLHLAVTKLLVIIALAVFSLASAPADNLEVVGVTLLRQIDPTLNGAGIRVAQPEAIAPAYQVNPAATGRPGSIFIYYSEAGVATNFPNAVGTESSHANDVGRYFYGLTTGVAPGASGIDNYDADFFAQNIIFTPSPTVIPARVVNQSFIFDTTTDADAIESLYDDFIDFRKTIVVTAIGNGGAIAVPAGAFNAISVADYDGVSSVGPADDGRCKPDLTAPGGATSYSTPYVAGAATVLLQAALRGDGGAGPKTNAASDPRTIKALLMNGAVKLNGWTNSPTVPLDLRHGAGIVNVFNAWHQLSAGKFSPVETNSVPNGSDPGTGSTSQDLPSPTGWNFQTISASRAHHYYFNFTAPPGSSRSLAATLVWHRLYSQASINNLDLYLYNTTGPTLVATSVSTNNNVEHLYLRQLPPGRYDLVVVCRSDTPALPDPDYALAWDFAATSLAIERSGAALTVSWPVAPDGFILQSTASLTPPFTWTNAPEIPVVLNERKVVTPIPGGTNRFFRLVRP